MTMRLQNEDAAQMLAAAFRSDDEAQIASAWDNFGNAIAEQIRDDYEMAQSDKAALQGRGYRLLTQKEEKWYNKVADALKQNPAQAKQAFIDIISSDDADDIMPETIIEDVMRYIAENRPLLQRIRFQYVGYSTKWIVNDNTTQKGAWGKIDAKITAEIQGALRVIDLTQGKYTGFCTIPLDLLDMGPTYMDAFVRATLAEALAYGIEDAVVNGTGDNMPTGLKYDPDSAFSAGTGYVKKTAVKVVNFEPVAYGELVSKVAKTAKGKYRVFSAVDLIVNPIDYLKKIMPATTVLTSDGHYVNNLFPFPTNVIPSTVVEEDEAILAILDDYTLAIGGNRNNLIEFDDSIGFLDDARTFKIVTHGAGRAYDNTSAVLLDLSDLTPQPLVASAAAEVSTTSSKK